ncbi:hypothetical protein KY285_009579 [Solanum tuberosum]|nr:hypothetical protein KY285_009579 [Solanum tuberosum]
MSLAKAKETKSNNFTYGLILPRTSTPTQSYGNHNTSFKESMSDSYVVRTF